MNFRQLKTIVKADDQDVQHPVNQLLALAEKSAFYQCPGETLPITSAVHQARLRAGYRSCLQCPHREDHTLFSAETKEHLQQLYRPHSAQNTNYVDGVRGLLHNELKPSDIRLYVRAYCQQLSTELSRTHFVDNSKRSLVVGHDSRPESLQVFDTTVKTAIEQGYRVVAIGETSGPCLQQTVRHLLANGGIYATGSECSSRSIGLNFIGQSGLPWSGESLHHLSELSQQTGLKRVGRNTGHLETFPASRPYLANLWKSYPHGSPLHLQIVCNNHFLREILQELSSAASLQLEFLDVTEEEFTQGLNHIFAVADWGVWLSEDGYGCRFFRPADAELSSIEVLHLLVSQALPAANRSRTLLLGEEWENSLEVGRLFPNDQVRYRASLAEIFYRGMKTSQAILGVDARHRYWFQEQTPVCDNLLTLARFLSAVRD